MNFNALFDFKDPFDWVWIGAAAAVLIIGLLWAAIDLHEEDNLGRVLHSAWRLVRNHWPVAFVASVLGGLFYFARSMVMP